MRKQFGTVAAVLVLCLSVFATPSTAAIRYAVTDLGSLDKVSPWAVALNNRGHVVGYDSQAFYYDGVAHYFLPDWSSSAYDINDNDLIVGWTSPGEAYYYDTQKHLIDHGLSAYGVNDAGAIVGQDQSGHAFVYDGTMHDLGTFGGDRSSARDINNNGQVVGWAQGSDFRSHAFIYDGSLRMIGPPDTDSYGEAINANGDAVGYFYYSNGYEYYSHAFMYSGGSVLDIGSYVDSPGIGHDAVSSEASGINKNGDVVGTVLSATRTYAFMYHGGQVLDLNSLIDPSLGWSLAGAYDINDSGQVVGMGINSLGQPHSFLLTPVPEPSGIVSLLGGICGSAGIILKRRRAR